MKASILKKDGASINKMTVQTTAQGNEKILNTNTNPKLSTHKFSQIQHQVLPIQVAPLPMESVKFQATTEEA